MSKTIVERCQTLLKDIENVQYTNEYRCVSLPKAKKIKLPNASLDALKFYVEQIIKHGGSTEFEWMNLMEPLGDERSVMIRYQILRDKS